MAERIYHFHGAEIEPFYRAVIEAQWDRRTEHQRISGFIKEFNRLHAFGTKNGNSGYFQGIAEIEQPDSFEVGKEDPEDYYMRISEKYTELESKLSALYTRTHMGDTIKRPSKPTGKEISLNQNQNNTQIQNVNLEIIANYGDVIRAIENSNVAPEVKKEGVEKIRTIELELKKEKPAKEVIKGALDWVEQFDKFTNSSIGKFIVSQILEHGTKILGI